MFTLFFNVGNSYNRAVAKHYKFADILSVSWPETNILQRRKFDKQTLFVLFLKQLAMNEKYN